MITIGWGLNFRTMLITTMSELEEAAIKYGILPFFRNNIKGFSVAEMTPPGLLFGGNEYEGCWEWKGPVVRTRTSAYGKFFRRKAGFVSLELLPYFLKFRKEAYPLKPDSTDEMIYDIISFNDRMSSTELRQTLNGAPRKRKACDIPDLETEIQPERKRPSRHSVEGPLQRLQMGGRICISDFKYKMTRKGERYGWGVAEYSTPETLFERTDLSVDLSSEECLDYMVEFIQRKFPGATRDKLVKLLS